MPGSERDADFGGVDQVEDLRLTGFQRPADHPWVERDAGPESFGHGQRIEAAARSLCQRLGRGSGHPLQGQRAHRISLKPLRDDARHFVPDRADCDDHLAGRGQAVRDQRPRQAAAFQQQALVPQSRDRDPAIQHHRRQEGAAFSDRRLRDLYELGPAGGTPRGLRPVPTAPCRHRGLFPSLAVQAWLTCFRPGAGDGSRS